MRLVGTKVSGAVNYMDLFTAGLVKYFEERALANVIGNGTIKSGAIKLAVAFLTRKFMGKGMMGDAVSLGFGIDGVEDILTNILGSGIAGIGGGSQNW